MCPCLYTPGRENCLLQFGQMVTAVLCLHVPTLIRLEGITSDFGSLVSQFVDLFCDLGHGGVNLGLVADEEWADDAGVDHVRTIPGDWEETPDQEEALKGRGEE